MNTRTQQSNWKRNAELIGATVFFALIIFLVIMAAGCSTAINTKDVTKIVVTTTGIKIGKGEVSQTPELTIGRNQVEYIKVPPATNGATAEFPNVVSRYEVNGHSAIFGNVSATSTLATGTNAVNTAVGGSTPPINNGVGTGSNLNTQIPK